MADVPKQLIGKGFDAHPEHRQGNGRKKGSRNRATIYREMLELEAIKSLQAKEHGIPVKSVGDQIAASMVVKAIAGDVSAANHCMDGAHGKIPDKIANTDGDGNDAPHVLYLSSAAPVAQLPATVPTLDDGTKK